MRITLNISPCPNDTCMFDALLNGRIDPEGLSFEVRFADIEELNAGVLGAALPVGTGCHALADVSKISYAVLPEIVSRYRVLESGSALGRGNGPLLVARGPVDTADASLRIAVPGLHTTANLLVRRLFPQLADRTPVLFSEIAARVRKGEFDAGVLIHEGRFTYAQQGLRLVTDLGAEWERASGAPLPLGAIAVSRALPEEVQRTVSRLVRRSVEYAFAHPAASAEFVRAHAQELSDEVTRSHIALFVNEYSLALGAEGRRAVTGLTGLGETDLFV